MSLRLAGACALAFATLAACTAPTSTPPAEATYSVVAERVLSNCTTRSCHSAIGRRGNLVLTPDVAYDQLVGVAADNEAAKAKGKQRVVPGDPDASFLVQKLEGPAADEGTRMPQSADKLSAEDIALVRAWIAAGAKR